MDIFKKCYEFTRADEAKAAGIYPYFRVLESRQDVEVIMEGRRRIMLGSNNYLGLTVCPEVVEAGIKAIEKYGTGCSGSRFLNGTLDLHVELESEIAKFLGKDGAITFGTGFQTNLGIISALVGMHDYVICDRENHASIYAGCQLAFGKLLRYRHNDMAELEECLKKVPEESGALIVVDGVFSMGGDTANLPEIVRLAKKYGARTMVDDAHGLGVLGEGGRGTAFHYGLAADVDIFMSTFSKSLASLGGYVAADAKVIDYLIIPLYTYTFEETLVAQKRIYDAGVYVNSVVPPATPEGECLLRTSYMASHTEALLDEAMDIIAKAMSGR